MTSTSYRFTVFKTEVWSHLNVYTWSWVWGHCFCIAQLSENMPASIKGTDCRRIRKNATSSQFPSLLSFSNYWKLKMYLCIFWSFSSQEICTNWRVHCGRVASKACRGYFTDNSFYCFSTQNIFEYIICISLVFNKTFLHVSLEHFDIETLYNLSDTNNFFFCALVLFQT